MAYREFTKVITSGIFSKRVDVRVNESGHIGVFVGDAYTTDNKGESCNNEKLKEDIEEIETRILEDLNKQAESHCSFLNFLSTGNYIEGANVTE